MCNGEFLEKNPNEAKTYFDWLVENAQQWDTPQYIDRSFKAITNQVRKACHIGEQEDLSEQISQLARKVKALERRNVEIPSQKFVEESRRICEVREHLTQEYPTILVFKEVLHAEVNSRNSSNVPLSSSNELKNEEYQFP